jgi:hypothetical protein
VHESGTMISSYGLDKLSAQPLLKLDLSACSTSEEFSNRTPVLGAYPSDVTLRENFLPEAADFVLGLVHRFCVVLFPFSFPSDAQTPFCREGSTLYSAGSTGRFLTIAEWHDGPKRFKRVIT